MIKAKDTLIYLPSKKSDIKEPYSIKEGVVNIAKYAITYSKNISSLALPSSLKTIGINNFILCDIESFAADQNTEEFFVDGGILFNKDKTTLISYPSKRSFEGIGEYTLPATVKRIGPHAFAFNNNINKLVITNNLESIGTGAFVGCRNMNNITFPDKIDYIEAEAFRAVGLDSLIIEKVPQAREIGYYAFGNTKLPSLITLNEGLISIGREAFAHSKGVETLEFPESLATIGEKALYSILSLKSIEFKDGIKIIPYKLASGCFNLEGITFSKNLNSIEKEAFAGCTNLLNVFLEETKIANIGELAFDNCGKIGGISFSATIETIAANAFANADLSIVYVKLISATPWSGDLYASIEALLQKATAIYVPSESVEVYKTADGWAAFSSKIQAIIEQ